MKGILLTQCVQADFLGPLREGDPLPNLVHVGALESLRLVGPRGSLLNFLRAAHATSEEVLGIIHIVDRHDPAKHRDHFDLFKPHCVEGTSGAELLDPIPALVAGRPGTRVVVGGNLSDFERPELTSALTTMAGSRIHDLAVGVVGVWTDVKVMFLLYDLATRFGVRSLATCSALTASRSLRSHFAALEHIRDVLGVTVFHSPGRFLEWLGVPAQAPMRAARPASTGGVTPHSWKEEEISERDALVEVLCPEETRLEPLGGGFSGAQVFLARDPTGAASVIKVGSRTEIASERFGNERIRRILGDGVPALLGHREGASLAAIRMELAESSDKAAGAPSTFKRLFESDLSDEATEALDSALRETLGNLLGRFYKTAEKDNADLLEAYGFVDPRGRPCWSDAVKKNAESIAARSGVESTAVLLSRMGLEGVWMTPAVFYDEWLPEQSRREEVFSSVVYGDLNLANILVALSRKGRGLFRTWVIDFARLSRLPNLTDFAKVENDLSFILLPVPDARAESRALGIQEARLASQGLIPSSMDALAETALERRYVRILLTLRKLAAEVDPRGEKAMSTYRVALMRYGAHTLGFDEPSLPQLRLALAAVARLGGLISSNTESP